VFTRGIAGEPARITAGKSAKIKADKPARGMAGEPAKKRRVNLERKALKTLTY
jgi:hypothetical protein